MGSQFPGRYGTRCIIYPVAIHFLTDSSTAFCLEPNDENTIEITSTANLSDIYDQQIDVRLIHHHPDQSITICHNQQRFRNKTTYPTAYCFHAWCHEILIKK